MVNTYLYENMSFLPMHANGCGFVACGFSPYI